MLIQDCRFGARRTAPIAPALFQVLRRNSRSPSRAHCRSRSSQFPGHPLPSGRTRRLRKLRAPLSHQRLANVSLNWSLLDSHFIQQMGALAPILFDLNEQFEVTAMAQQIFNIVTRTDADLFQPLRSVADYDLFLRVSLDEDRAIDTRIVFAYLFKALGHHRGNVRNFFPRGLEYFLAHNF